MRWRRKRSDEDFAEEIRAHLELERDRIADEGMTGEAARDAARRAFGNVAAAQERYYETRRWVWGDYLLKDLRYAFRRLRKTPWFTAAAVLILTFGIGANLAVFGLVDALMLRSIPVANPEQLVEIDPVGPQGRLNGMPSTVLDPLRGEPVLSGVCGFTTPRVTTNINGAIASTGTLSMTGDCFDTLGVRTQIGRPFSVADDRPDAPDVVVLTAKLWRGTFGGSPAVLGKQIQAGADSYTVIGVAADSFTGVLLDFSRGSSFRCITLPRSFPRGASPTTGSVSSPVSRPEFPRPPRRQESRHSRPRCWNRACRYAITRHNGGTT